MDSRNGAHGRPGWARLGRRALLRWMGLAAATPLLAACGGARAPGAPVGAGSAPSSAVPAGATGASASGAAPAAGKTLTIAQAGEISSFDPHVNGGNPDLFPEFNVFDTLVVLQTDLKLHPGLATEWKAVNDTTWEFKLRQGVKFHNGDPLTARDVKFSAERTMDPASGAAHNLNLISVGRVEAPDDHTVRFITKQPDPLLPNRLAVLRSQILPKDYFTTVGLDTFLKKPVGSGPLKFVEWKKDDRLVLARNDDYWGAKCAFETVIVRAIPEIAARLGALKKGEVQLISRLTPDHWDEVNQGPGFHGESVQLAGLYVLGVNAKRPGLSDPLVRQALSAAIDRPSLLKDVYRDQGIIPNGFIPKGSFAYDPGLPPYPFAPDKARQLLKQSRYNNEPIIIESAGYVAGDKQMSEALAGMWKDVGINSKVEVIEFSVRAEKKRDKSFKGLWWADPADNVFDPDGMMWFYLQPGGIYDYGWRDPEFDRAGEDASSTLDRERRLKDYQLMNRLFNQNFPLIPVFQPNLLFGVANSIDWKPLPSAVIDVRGDAMKIKG